MMDAKNTRMDEMLDDTALEQQLHRAYSSIEPSDKAQERMLANLLKAQANKQEQETQDMPAQTVVRPPLKLVEPDPMPEVSAGPRRRLIWLPIVAAVVAALVIVQVSGIMGGQNASSEAAKQTALSNEAATDAAGEMEFTDNAYETLSAEGAVRDSAEAPANPSTVDVYPCVTLSNGVKLTALIDGSHTERVEQSKVGSSVGAATATPFDSDDQVSCEAFELKGKQGEYAVRYQGEDSYWRCVPLKL
ncbi:MAG: hypothetical protein IKG11_08615 [Atopobiaceae bacterium]|nr:hypothetical protein [Atopobiaceae bacterium]